MSRKKSDDAAPPKEHRELPNNIEAEQALLGAILVNNAAYDRVSRFLRAEHFYEPLHRRIYDIAAVLMSGGKLATPISVKPFLPANETVGSLTVAEYLARLAAEAVTIVNAHDYGRMILDMAVRRSLIVACEEAANIAYDAPPEMEPLRIVDEAQTKLSQLVDTSSLEGATRVGIGQSYMDDLSAGYKRGEVRGVPIAFDEIARVLSEPCFEAGNHYGLLSSSGEGKTSLTLKLVYHALRQGHPVLIQSFDQSDKQFVRQMIAQAHEIEVRRQRDPKQLSEHEWGICNDFARWIDTEAPFDVVHCSAETAPQLVALAKRFVTKPNRRVGKAIAAGKTPLVVTDHIGQVTPHTDKADEGTKARRIGAELKAGARIHGYVQLTLQQRNTRGMERDNPRPISVDLFGGEGAKQPFDAIMYAYRFKKYYSDRAAVASSDADWKKIARVFPDLIRSGTEDFTEIGALKVRFGSGAEREQLDFIGRFTDFRSRQPAELQEAMF